MTNRFLTALSIRIAGIYLFTKIFDHFGSYFFSVFNVASLSIFEELFNKPIEKFYVTGIFLIIVNIIVSLFLFLKANWIAEKLIKTDTEIKTALNTESLTKVILLTVGVIWLAKLIYVIPNLIEYCSIFISKLNGNEKIELPDFNIANYLLKAIMTLFIVFRTEKISSWILKKI